MRHTTVAFVLLIVLSHETGWAQQRPLTENERRFISAVSEPLVYQVPGMDRVRVRKDIAYRTVEGAPLLADIYLPRSPKTKTSPVVIFVHGGVGAGLPVKPKDWGFYQQWGRLAAASGLVGVTFNHRLGFPEPYLREAGSDMQAIIDYVRGNAGQFGADPDRICIAAYSAGGPLLSPFLRDKPPAVRCLVSYYTFLDISQTPHHSKHEPPDVVREYSPITHLGPGIPPTLIVRAGADQIPALNESIARFVQRGVEVNAPITLMIHPTAPHGFDNKTKDDRAREIVKSTIDFLKWHLK